MLKELAEASGSSESKVAREGKTTYIVYLKEQADLRPAQLMATKLSRRQTAVSALQATARQAQAGIVAYLEQQKSAGRVTDYSSYWVFNGLAVTGDLETLLALATRPEVERIRANHRYQIPNSKSKIQNPKSELPISNLQTVEWNIARVRADEVWRDLDITGAGVVVANMDTGVDWTHPALQSKYRGSDSDHNYNWYDCTGTYPSAPADGDGHGTHTMGVMVGSDTSTKLGTSPGGTFHIGMAPDAQWIAVKVLDDDGVGYDTWIHAGFQWLLAPTDLNGNNPDPSKAPDVVNNSWGPSFPNVADLTFLPDVQALRAAGIFPVFGAGNSGELGDGTVAAPAGYPESFAVGATDFEDTIASFSGRGPSFWGEFKPEVSAPGVDIRSSVPGGGYEGGWSGTSMATPHAAGLAALLLSADPTLTISELENFMKYTAADFGDTGADNAYGWGRIDAYQAVRWVLGAGRLYGKVTASNLEHETSNVKREASVPIPGARVSGVSQAGDQFTATTNDAGVYEVAVPGSLYEVTASAFGYYSKTVRAVEVITDFMSIQDFALQPSPTGTLVGRVTEAGTGQFITATISAIDTPALTSTDANGYYTLTLPVGTYAVKVTSHGHKAQTVTGISIASDERQTLDFALETAPSILLVDADVWAGDSVTNYYEWALDYEGYFYDTRPITDTAYLPTAAELSSYDVVLWASPWSSPGYINADEELMSYVDGGGRLLISGQDIGYWDSKDGFWARAPLFYYNYLRAQYVRDYTRINDLKGLADDVLEGVNLTLEDVYAHKKGDSLASDEVTPADGYAASIINYEGDGSGGLKADVCEPNPYRVVYLSFGYEGAGPRPGYAAVLDRTIQWLVAPRPLRGVSLRPKSQYNVEEPGTSLQYSARVVNDGQTVGAYDISLSGNAWPTAILDKQTMKPITRTEVLSPCGWRDLLVQVDIPPSFPPNGGDEGGAAVGEVDTVTVRATMADHPSVSSTITVTSRAFPAWSYKSRMLTSRYRLAAVTVGCEFYAIGGWDWSGASTVNEMYDPVADFWTTKASKPTGVANVGAAALNDRIYVIGGMSNNLRLLSAVEFYDPATDSWASVAPLPVGLSGTAVAAADGKLYVFGGDSDSGSVNTTYEYDPAADIWTQKASMPAGPRSYAAATALNDKIYVAGGWPDLRTFEEYDPATDIWATKAPLLRGRQSPGLVAIGGFIYAVGGGSGWGALGTVERYDPTTDTWVPVSSLNKGRIGTGTAVAGGGIYVVGGVDIYSEAVPTNEGLALENSLCPSSKKVDKVTASPGEVLTYTIA
ncbi:MAG: S8 family serine peptidase, partial [Anaerolineae bacterium]